MVERGVKSEGGEERKRKIENVGIGIRIEKGKKRRKKRSKKKSLQHRSFAYGLPLHYSVRLLVA